MCGGASTDEHSDHIRVSLLLMKRARSREDLQDNSIKPCQKHRDRIRSGTERIGEGIRRATRNPVTKEPLQQHVSSQSLAALDLRQELQLRVAQPLRAADCKDRGGRIPQQTCSSAIPSRLLVGCFHSGRPTWPCSHSTVPTTLARLSISLLTSAVATLTLAGSMACSAFLIEAWVRGRRSMPGHVS